MVVASPSRTGHSALVLTAHEMSEFALLVAREAIDRMIDYIESDLPPYEEAVAAEVTLIDSRERDSPDLREPRGMEHHAAMIVLNGARAVAYPTEYAGVDVIDPHDGYRRMADHNE